MDHLNFDSIQEMSQTIAQTMGVDSNTVSEALAAASQSGLMGKMLNLQKSLFRIQSTYSDVVMIDVFVNLLAGLGMQRHNEMPEDESDLDEWTGQLIDEVRPAWETFIGGFLPHGEIDFNT